MPGFSDVAARAKDPLVFRQIAQELLHLADSDWTAWEEHWLPAMLRYADEHVYTEAEREKLAQLSCLSEPCSGHDGLPVEQMIALCLRYHADFSEADGEFVVGLNRRGAKSVRRRELRRLANLCKEAGVEVNTA
jgi:hypothetical protein